VQLAVHILKDGPLVDLVVLIVIAELLERPVGDVLAAVGAVFVIDVKGEALRTALGSRERRILSNIPFQVEMAIAALFDRRSTPAWRAPRNLRIRSNPGL